MLQNDSPEDVDDIHMPDDPPGQYENFCWVNNEEEYDATPVGDWMKDPQGNVAKKRSGLRPNDPGESAKNPIVLHCQADEDKVMDGQWVVDAHNAPWKFYGHLRWETWATN